jgi:hypothetical protein
VDPDYGHPSSAYNSEMVPRFLENLCIPMQVLCPFLVKLYDVLVQINKITFSIVLPCCRQRV